MICPVPSKLPLYCALTSPTGIKPALPQTSVPVAVLLASTFMTIVWFADVANRISCNWWALRIDVEYSEASIGKVAPTALAVLFSVPSTSTITQLLPAAPAVVVKVKLPKLLTVCICAALSPLLPDVPPVPTAVPVPDVVVFQ